MKIHSVYAKNFGSYAELDFNPSGRGLSLIYGPTGSGKSTIPDIISWTLFGVTAKDGNADEVKSWSTPDQPTIGEVYVDDIIVVRQRGKPNDLYWIDSGGATHRGKDLLETQLLLRHALGYHGSDRLFPESLPGQSPSLQFFNSTAKARREVLEQVVDLSLPVKLATKITESKKGIKTTLVNTQTKLDTLLGSVQSYKDHVTQLQAQAADWEERRSDEITRERTKANNFDTTKASKVAALTTKWHLAETKNHSLLISLRDEALATEQKATKAALKHSKCDKCGTIKGHEELKSLRQQLHTIKSHIASTESWINPYVEQIDAADREENRSERRITDLLSQTNPHVGYLVKSKKTLQKKEEELDILESTLVGLKTHLSTLDHLYDLSFQLRGHLLQTAVKTIEDQTNRNLEAHFDSEFRVSFSVEDGDSIDVSIFKGGYPCVFKQLSKGQRQLLKLCFSISIMEASANASGVHFEQIFLDEPLDGLDDTMKVKAFSLLEELAQNHDSVFVIDHCQAFQDMFSSKFKISLRGEHSSIEHE